MIVRVGDHRRAEVVNVDSEEIEQVAVARAVEAVGAELPDVVRLGADLDSLEVGAGVEGIQGLREIDVPNS